MYLKETLSNISLKWGYRLQELKPDSFSIEISLVRNKVDTRFQMVTVQRENMEGKPSRIYIQGYCGVINDSLPLRDILRSAISYNYCTAALLDTKDKDGNPVTELIVQSCPQDEFTTPELLDAIIFEVADKADYLVLKYFEETAPKFNLTVKTGFNLLFP